jgi:hypothetical protein
MGPNEALKEIIKLKVTIIKYKNIYYGMSFKYFSAETL